MKKILSYLGIFLFTFFICFTSVHAETYTIGALKPYYDKGGEHDPIFEKYSYNFKKWNSTKGIWENATRKLRTEVYYAKPKSSSYIIQGYCIEELVEIFEGAYDSTGNGSDKITGDQKDLISKMLVNANNIIGEDKITLDQYKKKVNDLKGKEDEKVRARAKVLGTQELIWEVTRGERWGVDPKNRKPDKCKSNSNASCPFWNLLNNPKYTNDSNLGLIKNEYNRLIDATYYTFERAPGSDAEGSYNKFSPTESYAKHLRMTFNGSEYEYTIYDPYKSFKYFNVSVNKGIKYEVDKDGAFIKFTTPNLIDGVALVTLKNKTHGAAKDLVFSHGKYQDVISTQANINYYLKLETPPYQLKIKKIADIDEKPLKGVEFDICQAGDSTCTKPKLGHVTTNENGEATFAKIPFPGTYYVKETSVPDGYIKVSKPIKVEVKESHVAGKGEYGSITVRNGSKEFNLEKYTVDEDGKVVILDDGCGTEKYTGPVFELTQGFIGKTKLYFKELKPGEYKLSSIDEEGSTTDLKTCNGKFKIYNLTDCNYTITETKAPEGLTLPANRTKKLNVCGADKKVSFTNGFAGLEFQKKDEDGNFLSGGKFSLQRKINNVYSDVLLKEKAPGSYEYDKDLTEEDEGATYIITTAEGIARISKLPPGEYRISEKEAPEGYEVIKDKDSKALVTIKDSDKDGYYLVEMIDNKISKSGSKSYAELIVTIITGRKVRNYVLIIGGLAILLVAAIIVRKK